MAWDAEAPEVLSGTGERVKRDDDARPSEDAELETASKLSTLSVSAAPGDATEATAPAARCPFRGWFGTKAAAAPAPGGPAPATCPFSGKRAGAAPAPASPDPQESAQRCPYSGAALPEGVVKLDAAALTSGAGGCPLGYGRGNLPKVGHFHCVLCRGLYHDCTVLGCGHRYCGGCIAPASACPVCGADIETRTPDAETQATVEAYLDAHAGHSTLWDLDGDSGVMGKVSGRAGRAEEGVGGARPASERELIGGQGEAGEAAGAAASSPAAERASSRAAFLLALGVRQAGAGNAIAAEARLRQSLEALGELQAIIDAAEAQEELGAASRDHAATTEQGREEDDDSLAVARSDLMERRGGVLGVLGDLARSRGDAAEAAKLYSASARVLASVPRPSPEAQHALSVTQNKTGDLEYVQGHVAAALELYEAALAGRRAAVAARPDDPRASLDLATSLVKVADARRAATGSDFALDAGAAGVAAAEAMVAEAASIVRRLQRDERTGAAGAPLPPQALARLEALGAHLGTGQ